MLAVLSHLTLQNMCVTGSSRETDSISVSNKNHPYWSMIIMHVSIARQSMQYESSLPEHDYYERNDWLNCLSKLLYLCR